MSKEIIKNLNYYDFRNSVNNYRYTNQGYFPTERKKPISPINEDGYYRSSFIGISIRTLKYQSLENETIDIKVFPSFSL